MAAADVPLGMWLLPPVLVNRMWSRPSSSIPVPVAAPPPHGAPSAVAAVLCPPGSAGGCCPHQLRDRQSRGKGLSGSCSTRGRGPSVAVGLVAPLQSRPERFAPRAADGCPPRAESSGCRQTPAHHPLPSWICPPPPSPPPLLLIASWCLSLLPGTLSSSSQQAMGCVGVLATPEDPKEQRGAQGEGSCPPECQELAAVSAPQAVRYQGAWDRGCPHFVPTPVPRVVASPLGWLCPSSPPIPWGACVRLLPPAGL